MVEEAHWSLGAQWQAMNEAFELRSVNEFKLQSRNLHC